MAFAGAAAGLENGAVVVVVIVVVGVSDHPNPFFAALAFDAGVVCFAYCAAEDPSRPSPPVLEADLSVRLLLIQTSGQDFGRHAVGRWCSHNLGCQSFGLKFVSRTESSVPF